LREFSPQIRVARITTNIVTVEKKKEIKGKKGKRKKGGKNGKKKGKQNGAK